jgi:uncharacterized protein DUF4430
MISPRGMVAAVALVGVAAAAGCGLGAGPKSAGDASLTVTRDYGATQLKSANARDPVASETAMRFLDRNADITTRYGGRFVQSIDGLAGGSGGSRRRDWFFYVNGVESSVGAADIRVHAGDRVWWDYRDWTAAMRVPGVVGSYPEPLVGKRATIEVATWPRLPAPIRDLIQGGPARSGVFARFRGTVLLALDERGKVAKRLSSDAGLVAVVRVGDGRPTWVVTGGDAAGVRAARGLLRQATLRNRYAVATDGGRVMALPAR